MAPLKVWQLQDLSLQAAARIMNSPAENQVPILGVSQFSAEKFSDEF
jgi:hypothetical protein